MRDYYVRLQAKSLLNKKPVRKGDLILTSEPFAFAINTPHLCEFCGYCMVSCTRNVLLSPCKNCRLFWYCSESCKRLGWDYHKYECHRLKRMSPEIPSAFVRLLARIIFLLKNGGDKITEKVNEREARKFRDLMNHYADVKKDEEAKREVDQILPILRRYIGNDNLPNYSDFLGIYGRVLVNRFCLFDDTMMTFGSGVYLAASIFDHACIPNCYVSFSGRKVQIRSLVDMKEIDYTKLRIGYVDPVCSAASRKHELYRRWFFWCDCKTCADKERIEMENSVYCDTEGCNTLVYIPEEFKPDEPHPVCKKCQVKVDDKKVKNYREAVHYTQRILKEMSEENPSLTDCLDILETQGDMFHPLNVWRVRALDFAFNACIFNGCWSLADDYGDKNYEGMRHYYGDENPTLALFFYKLGKAKIYLMEYRQGVTLLDQAERILSIALGPTYPLIEREIVPLNLMANDDPAILAERMTATVIQKRKINPSLVRILLKSTPAMQR